MKTLKCLLTGSLRNLIFNVVLALLLFVGSFFVVVVVVVSLLDKDLCNIVIHR